MPLWFVRCYNLRVVCILTHALIDRAVFLSPAHVFKNIKGWIGPLQEMFLKPIEIQVGNFCTSICIYTLILQLLSVVGTYHMLKLS